MYGYGEWNAPGPSVEGLEDEQAAVDMAGQIVGERTIKAQAPSAMKLWESEDGTEWFPRGYVVGTPIEGEPTKAMVSHRDRLD